MDTNFDNTKWKGKQVTQHWSAALHHDGGVDEAGGGHGLAEGGGHGPARGGAHLLPVLLLTPATQPRWRASFVISFRAIKRKPGIKVWIKVPTSAFTFKILC